MRMPFDNPDLYEDEPEQDAFDNMQRDHEMWIAGALAKAAEEAGLIQKTDDFSWEWHQMFDAEIEAAKAQLSEPELGATTEMTAEPTPLATPSPPSNSPPTDLSGDLSADFDGGGFGGGFSGDLGGNF